MAHHKRSRPKQYTVSVCGSRHCKYDQGKYRGNGRLRYLPAHWKQFGGRSGWRYTQKNIT